MYTLKNFSLMKSSGNPFSAPETCPNVLSGKVYGHPCFEDGSRIETSIVVEVNGRIVKTSSGSEYRLYGPARKEFRKWLEEKGIKYNSDNPLGGLENYYLNGGFNGTSSS